MMLTRTWNHIEDANFGLANVISQKVDLRERLNPLLLTDVRRSNELLIACDFGGSHKQSQYLSYSFLAGAISASGEWDRLRQDVRTRLLRDDRRMSYKSLGDAIRTRSLVPFLHAADSFPGVLATLLVDRRIEVLVGDHRSPNVFPELVVAERGWNRTVFHKLCLIASFGSMLIRALSDRSQDILWVTDQDEIAPNPTKHNHAGHVIHHHISTYAPNNTGLFVLITTEADITSRRFEDVVAIPDLAAGALGEVFSQQKLKFGQAISSVWLPFPNELPSKAECIAKWFFGPTHRLAKLAIMIEPDREGLKVEVVSALTR